MAGRMSVLLVVAALVALLTPAAHACEPWQRDIGGTCTTATRVAIPDSHSGVFDTDGSGLGFSTGFVAYVNAEDQVPAFLAQPYTGYFKTFSEYRANVFSGYLLATSTIKNFEVQVWEDDTIFHASWKADFDEEVDDPSIFVSAVAKGSGKWTIVQVNWNAQPTYTFFMFAEWLLCASEDISTGVISAPEDANTEAGINPVTFVNFINEDSGLKFCPFVCAAIERLAPDGGSNVKCAGPETLVVGATFNDNVAPDAASARIKLPDNTAPVELSFSKAYTFKVSDYAPQVHKVVVSASGDIRGTDPTARKAATAAFAESRPGPMTLQVFEDGNLVGEYEFTKDTVLSFISKGNGAFSFTFVNWEIDTLFTVLPGNFVFDVYCLVGSFAEDSGAKVCRTPPVGETCVYQNDVKFNPWERWNVFGSEAVMNVMPADATTSYIATVGRIAGGVVQISGTVHSAPSTAEPYIGKTVPRFSISSPGEVVVGEGSIVSGGIETLDAVTLQNDATVDGDIFARGHVMANSAKITGKAYAAGYDGASMPAGGLATTPTNFRLSADFEVVDRYFIHRSVMLGALPDSNLGYNVSNGVLRVRVHGKLNVLNLQDLNDATVPGTFKQIREVVLVGHPHGSLVINVNGAADTTLYALSVVYEDRSGTPAPPTFGRVLLNILWANTVVLRDIDNPDSEPAPPKSRMARKTGSTGTAKPHGARGRRVVPLDMSTHTLHMAATKSRLVEIAKENPREEAGYTHVSILAPKAVIVNARSGIRGNVFGRAVQSFDANYDVQPFGTYAFKLAPQPPRDPNAPPKWTVAGARKVACLWHSL